MTRERFELTRRKILASVGAVGVAGAGAGMGTSALFSDEESFTNNSITAGTLDMSVTAEVVEASEYYTTSGDGPDVVGEMETADGAAVVGLRASDVKPGDWIIICFEISVGDNPAYVRVSAEDFAQYENGQTEPEAEVDGSGSGSLGMPQNGQGAGELQDELVAEVYDGYDASNDTTPPRSHLIGKHPNLSGTARSVFEQFATGIVIGGGADPIAIGSSDDGESVTRYLLLEVLPEAGNDIQSDAIEFDLVFEAQQVRNNDGFDPSSSLVGYWPLNSIEDGTAEDLSGNGNHGTPNSVSSALGQVDGAADFADTGWISLSGFPNLQSSFTISAWIQTRDKTKEGQRIFLDDENNTGGYGFSLGDPGSGQLRFYSRNLSTVSLDTGDVIDNNTWYHVVAVADTDAGTREIYVNGTQEATDSFSNSWGTDSGTASIGGETANGDTDNRFDGVIDDVRVYNRALSSSEVNNIYDATK